MATSGHSRTSGDSPIYHISYGTSSASASSSPAQPSSPLLGSSLPGSETAEVEATALPNHPVPYPRQQRLQFSSDPESDSDSDSGFSTSFESAPNSSPALSYASTLCQNDGSASDLYPEKGFPFGPMAVLALVRLSEPIALTSIFPYAWPLVKGFAGSTQDDPANGPDDGAAFKAGMLIAAFSLAEAATGMIWGAVSDKIGRKPVLLLGCAGTLLSLLMVGLATSFWTALAGRLLGGLLNGNIGVIQTMVTELVTKKEHAARAFSMIPFIWTMGAIVGPCIGGYFAEPAGRLIDPNTTNPFLQVLVQHPYLFPNVVCAGLMAFSITVGAIFLPETNPATRRKARNQSSSNEVLPSPDSNMYGTFEDSDAELGQNFWLRRRTTKKISKSRSKLSIPRSVKVVIVALGIFTFHSMCFDHLLPMFLQDAINASVPLSGGLGLSTDKVGMIIGATGFYDLFLQLMVFPWTVLKFGNWKTFKIVTWIHPIPLLLMPFLVTLVPPSYTTSITNRLNSGSSMLPIPFSLLYVPNTLSSDVLSASSIDTPALPPSSSLSPLVVLGLVLIIALRASSSIIAYPVLLLMINEAVTGKGKTDPSHPNLSSCHQTEHSPLDETRQLLAKPSGPLFDPHSGVVMNDYSDPTAADSSSHLGAINGLSASVGAASRMLASPVSGFLFGIGSNIGVSALPWWFAAVIALIGVWQMRTFPPQH